MCSVHAWCSQKPDEGVRFPDLETQTLVRSIWVLQLKAMISERPASAVKR